MLTAHVCIALTWTWAFLWCQSCAQDECKDVSDEIVRSKHAQSLLQKQTLQRKANLTISLGQTPVSAASTITATVGSATATAAANFSVNHPGTSQNTTSATLVATAMTSTNTANDAAPVTNHSQAPGASQPETNHSQAPGASQPETNNSQAPGASQPETNNSQAPGASQPVTNNSQAPGASQPETNNSQAPGASQPVTNHSQTPGTSQTKTSATVAPIATTTTTAVAVTDTTTTTTFAVVAPIAATTTTRPWITKTRNTAVAATNAATTTESAVVAPNGATTTTTSAIVATTTSIAIPGPQPQPAGCPASCHGPACVKGGRYNGGVPLDLNRKCNYFCSREYAGGVRYCGTGSAYNSGEGVDCSGCAVDLFVHAADGAMTCPTGYDPLNNIQACMGGFTIDGRQYAWSGSSGCTNQFWPREGCFTYGDKVYFSTCGTGRALSTWAHSGICKKRGSVGITTTTTTAAVYWGCPDMCKSPKCVTGGKYNGGLPLVNGKCYYHCSQEYSGLRYCGSGSDYITGGGDCSGCAAGQYVHAGDGSDTCPTGYQAVIDLETCSAGVTIDGTQYTWSGRSDCSWHWPRSGCFSYANRLYFSNCDISNPLSQYEHYGICKKI